MKISDSVRKAIDDWKIGELESAMIHACNAVDGTAKKVYPNDPGSNSRFTRLLRDHYSILGPMAIPVPGFDLANYRFNVRLPRPKALGGTPDAADVIYGIHRCGHNHGEDLPDGYELIADAAGATGITHISHEYETGKVRFSDRLIFGLLSVVVYSPVNSKQRISDGYYLTYGDHVFMINEWWGRIDEIREIVDKEPPLYMTVYEYGD